MPIYEYHCPKCGQFELMQRITEAALTKCPTCRRKVTKLMSSTSFQLKGSGWYLTDYARAGEKTDKSGKGKAAGGESVSSGESAAAKSDDSKRGDSKSGDSKGGDSKGGDSKSSAKSESKSAKGESAAA